MPGSREPVPVGTEITLPDGANRERGEVLHLARHDSVGQWTQRYTLTSEESFANVAPRAVTTAGNRISSAVSVNDVRAEGTGSVNVFERGPNGNFAHRATLVASDSNDMTATPSRLSDRAVISEDGRRVAARGSSGTQSIIYIFDLPQTLPASVRVEDTFEDMNAAGWTPFGSTQWSVVASGNSRVYRQSNTTGDARAILDEPVTANQSIEADVKLNSFGSTSWAGLITRYTDPSNFYYLMIWNNQTVQIRRMVNGVFEPVAVAPFNPVAGRTYRLRLESVGTSLRGYVDGQLMVQGRDTSLASGRAGLTMWKTAAEYDNVIVSTSHQSELLRDTFAQTEEEQLTPWALSPANLWNYRTTAAGATVLEQPSITATARAINGAPAGDQIITADIRPLAYHANGTPFAGLITRYIDDNNYYYALLDKQNKISLRKLTNGTITVLDETPMTIQPGVSYRVRMEAIGNSLRIYVNGRLMTEAEDASYPSGRYGLMTYRTTAQYDNFSAVRP